jgi:hypothetical protein
MKFKTAHLTTRLDFFKEMMNIIVDGIKHDKLEHGHNLGCLSTNIGDPATMKEFEDMKKEIVA